MLHVLVRADLAFVYRVRLGQMEYGAAIRCGDQCARSYADGETIVLDEMDLMATTEFKRLSKPAKPATETDDESE